MSKNWNKGEEITAEGLNNQGLKVVAQDTPGLTLKVNPGVAIVDGTIVKYLGGNTGTFVAPVTDDRIDIVSIDAGGVINITQGVEDPSPVAPAYLADETVLCEVYLRAGCTEILNEDDSAEAYISLDSRPLGAGISLIEETTGAADAGKGTKTDADGLLHPSFLGAIMAGAFEAGEDIDRGDSLFLGLNEAARHEHNTNTGTQLTPTMANSTYYRSNTYTTPDVADVVKIKKAVIYEGKTGSSSSGGTNFGTYQMLIRAVDGSDIPTGADLFTSDVVQIHTFNKTDSELELPFSTPAELDPNTKYAFILKYISTDTDAHVLRGGGSPTGYVRGDTSSDGSSWSSWNNPFYLKFDYIFGDVGKLYKTSALYRAASKFFGFALKDALATETCYAGKGRCPLFSGLTPGLYYYLSNTKGAIASSAGTVPKKIGMASLATEIYSGTRPKMSNSSISIASGEPIPFDGMYLIDQTTTSAVSIIVTDEAGNALPTITWDTVDSDRISYWIPVNAGYSVNQAGTLTPFDYV